MSDEAVRVKVVKRGEPNLRKLARALLLLVEQQAVAEPPKPSKASSKEKAS